jgi:hypothetical protein
MTTQTLAQTIHLRHQLPVEQLISLFPAFSDDTTTSAGSASLTEADRTFWTTFAFGSMQALVLFALIYAYFAL